MKKIFCLALFALGLLVRPCYCESTDVKVSNLQYIETKRGAGYVFLSFKVDVENNGPRGKVFVMLVGKDANGFQISSVHASGVIEENGVAPLTTTTSISYDENQKITSWEIGEVDKYSK